MSRSSRSVLSSSFWCRIVLLAVALSGCLPLGAPILTPSAPPAEPAMTRPRLSPAFGTLPLHFVENRGQLDPRVAYYVQGRQTSLYFTRRGLTVALTGPSGEPRMARDEPDVATRSSLQRWAVRLDFVGADPAVRPAGQDQTPAIVSYFRGPQAEWRTGLPTYGGLVYSELWPGIDLVYRGTASELKYTFHVKPGADPGRIRLAYRGASAVTLTQAGELAVATPIGGFNDAAPVAWQETAGQQVAVAAAYALDAEPTEGAHGYGFRLGAYDPSLPLMLDPAVLVYVGYIGGTDVDDAFAMAVDASGNAYVTGETRSTEASFPDGDGFGALGGPDASYNGDFDAYVAKVKADGSGLVYVGYIGGSGVERSRGIAVDASGNAYIAGSTDSPEASFPVAIGPDLSYNGNSDAFVAKVNADGTGLLYAGYIGGGFGDSADVGNVIALDGSGQAFVTGQTSSTEASFPDGDGFGALGGPDTTHNGDIDIFVAKVQADGTGLVYVGYLGGSGVERGHGIAVDAFGNAYITGETNSTEASFPDGDGFGTLDGPDTTHNGGFDAFVAKVNASGSGLVYAGYIGGSDRDVGIGIAVDGDTNVYVTGQTGSAEASFPDGDGFGALGGPDTTHNGLNDAFVVKVEADGSGLVYAGYIGGLGFDVGGAIAVDTSGNAYVTGQTTSTEASFPVAVGPDLTHNGGDDDAYVAKVKADGSGLVYAGYIGGSGFDTGRGIAVDGLGDVYVAGNTDSTEASFPVLVGPDTSFNGGEDGFVAKITEAPPAPICVGDKPSLFETGLADIRAINTRECAATPF